ncbi:MAG: hypothetical protein M3Q34_04660 [bacterium]|nr:hypothetical protein [bacterium]
MESLNAQGELECIIFLVILRFIRNIIVFVIEIIGFGGSTGAEHECKNY